MDQDWPDSEFPTPRADIEVRREKTGIRLEDSAGPIKEKPDLFTSGEADAPIAVEAHQSGNEPKEPHARPGRQEEAPPR